MCGPELMVLSCDALLIVRLHIMSDATLPEAKRQKTDAKILKGAEVAKEIREQIKQEVLQCSYG